MNSKNKIIVLISLFVIFSHMSVAAECGGKEDGGCNNKKKALSLKIIAIFSILGASMTGICLPLALSPERGMFSVVKAFAGGITLATGFMHVLPDSFEMLSSSCLKESPWHEFSLSGFAAMISAVITLMIDSMATSFYSNKHRAVLPANGGERETPVVEAGHSHFHGREGEGSQLLRYRVVAMVEYKLIYMALVDVLAAEFMGAKLQASINLRLTSYVALLFGMSLLAKWT